VTATLVVSAALPLVYAETVTAPAVKAAFLYNFAKFTEWPSDTLAPRQRLALCVIGDSAVAEALAQTIKGRSIDGHDLAMEVVEAGGPIRSCHLLFVSGLDAKRSAQLFEALKGAAVFTVSDGEKFAELGGVAQLIPENDRIRFAINVMSAERARLRLSSKLLSLATIVKDQSDVPR
jgi:hypothetical protein